jgi:hypothetical protein
MSIDMFGISSKFPIAIMITTIIIIIMIMIIIMHSQVCLTDTLNSVFVDIVFGKER